MTSEELHQMARSAGGRLESWMTNPPRTAMWHFTPDALEKLVQQAMDKRRDECLVLVANAVMYRESCDTISELYDSIKELGAS